MQLDQPYTTAESQVSEATVEVDGLQNVLDELMASSPMSDIV
jgi:hypothetical protein